MLWTEKQTDLKILSTPTMSVGVGNDDDDNITNKAELLTSDGEARTKTSNTKLRAMRRH